MVKLAADGFRLVSLFGSDILNTKMSSYSEYVGYISPYRPSSPPPHPS